MKNNLFNSFLENLQIFAFILNSLMPILFVVGLIVAIMTILEFKKSLKLKNHLLQVEVNEYDSEVEAQHLMEEILKAEAESDEITKETTVEEEAKQTETTQEAQVVEVLQEEKQDSKKSFKFKKK